MKIRTRITIVLAMSLTIAGSLTLIINAVTLQRAPYATVSSFHDALLGELGVPRDVAIKRVRENPELIFSTPGDTTSSAGMTIDQAAQNVQQRRIDEALANARRWTVFGVALILAGAVAVGWFLSGQILRPIRALTARARAASAGNASTRLSAHGPNDELKELADTFDSLLDRLALAYAAQRRFAAQVANELRTPLTTTRTEVDVLLADNEDIDLREPLEAVAEAVDRADHLVSKLLVLSRTDARDLDRERFDLDELVGNVVGRAVESEPWSGLHLELSLQTSPVDGDRALLESLVRNLVENAARHNQHGGWVTISVKPSADGAAAVLDIANSVARTRSPGHGELPGTAHTGLSIVAAVIDAHRGTIEWRRESSAVHARIELPADEGQPDGPRRRRHGRFLTSVF